MTDGSDDWDAAAYDDACAFVADRARDLLDLLDPAPGERIADVGCGTGTLTREIADAGASVLGLDRSAEMVARARTAHPDLRFVRADAEALPLGEFDAVFSNATLHWIDDQDAALSSIREALRPGGRLVAEFGASGNVAAITGAVGEALEARGYDGTHPWHFPTPGEYARRLEEHGFEVRLLRLFDRPTPLSGGENGLATWLEVFGGGLFEPLSPAEVEAVQGEVEDRLRDELFEAAPASAASRDASDGQRESDGQWIADYRRLRVVAVHSP